jgi:hypothetical protein
MGNNAGLKNKDVGARGAAYAAQLELPMSRGRAVNRGGCSGEVSARPTDKRVREPMAIMPAQIL